MTTTYCVIADVAAVLSDAGVLACLDDDENGVLSVAEEALGTSAIERAAVKMNFVLQRRFVLSELDNDWCKWCNATLAAREICSRRNNAPVSESLGGAVKEFMDQLEAIGLGSPIPEQAESFEHTPTVSVLKPELWHRQPIAVLPTESDGSAPEGDYNRRNNSQGYY